MQSRELIPILRRAGGRGMLAVLLVALALFAVGGWRAAGLQGAPDPVEIMTRLQETRMSLASTTGEISRLTNQVVQQAGEIATATAKASELRNKLDSWALNARYRTLTWATKLGVGGDAYAKVALEKARAEFDLKQQEERLAWLRDAQQKTNATLAALQGNQQAQTRLQAALEKEYAELPYAVKMQSEVKKLAWKWRWPALAFVVFFITPVATWLRKILVWFIGGTLAERLSKPVTFPPPATSLTNLIVGQNAVSLDVELRPGEEAWFRDALLDRTTKPRGESFGIKWLLSWRYVFMSLLDGLWLLSRIRGTSEPLTSFRVSDSGDATAEFSRVTLSVGESLLLRPRFLAGLILPPGGELRLRRHWRLHCLHAWLFGQLWFYEISGPVTLVLRATRGVKAQRSSGDPAVETRLNPGALVAFSPRLRVSARRSENVWQYVFGDTPAFDTAFEGEAVFIAQETCEGRARRGPLAWLGGIGDALFKLAGF